MFCVWKTINNERKRCVVVDIRDLNVIIQSNVYSLSLQIDIILIVRDCSFITIVDCFAFFYQWRIYFID